MSGFEVSFSLTGLIPASHDVCRGLKDQSGLMREIDGSIFCDGGSLIYDRDII